MELSSCDLRGAQPLNSVYFLEMRAHKNRYSVVKGYFRFKKLSINRCFTRYRVAKLRCLPSNIISKCLLKTHTRKESP